MADEPTPRQKPFWWPDTQGFLAAAIVFLIGGVVIILIFKQPPVDQAIFGVLTTVLGVLTGAYKDVYGFFFGSSQGSKDKDAAITQMATGNGHTETKP